jgi:hypothetical protein
MILRFILGGVLAATVITLVHDAVVRWLDKFLKRE